MKVVCKSCGQAVKASERHYGKKVKCPGCENPISIPLPKAMPAPAKSPPVVAPQPESVEDDDFDFMAAAVEEPRPVVRSAPQLPAQVRVETVTKPASKLGMVVVGAMCLVIGYFAGREHLKHQMLSALTKVGESFAAGLGSGPKEGQAEPAKEIPVASAPIVNPEPKADSPAPIAELKTDPVPPAPKVAEFGINAPFQTETFAISLIGAAVRDVPLQTSFGDETESAEPHLMVSFSVQNVHDRKILHFSGGNSFGPSQFRLTDDVDNSIRGINFGITNKVVGAMTRTADIPPGEAASHIEVFNIPPPKTQFLILTMDAKAFGGEGLVRFRIPAETIEGFRN